MRREHAPLRRGALQFVRGGGPDLLVYWRSTPQERIVVAVNLSQRACALPPLFTSAGMLYAHGVEAGSLGAFGCAIARA